MPNIDEAIEALLAYQQADMEGVMVLTSRQAIHEVADELKRVRSHAQDAALRECPTCVRRFKPGEHCDLETCSLRQETSREAFEQAWRARPWLHDPESGKDRAWRWWSAGAAARTPAASDIPERFKHEVAAIANELGMDHQDLTTGKIAEFARSLRAERDQAISQVEKLTTALRFYADSKRYEGPNLSPIPDDPYAPEQAAYRWDVTRDHGRIASRALTSTLLTGNSHE